MLDKFAGLLGSSAKSMADSARSIEHFAEVLESQVETQNALLTTLIDKLGKGGGGVDTGGGEKGKLGQLADSAKGVSELSRTLPELVKGLAAFRKEKKGAESFISFLDSIVNILSENSVHSKQYEAVGMMFQAISQSMTKLAFGLMMFNTLTTDSGNDRFISFLSKFLSEVVSKIDGKKTAEAAESISNMAKAIAVFGYTMAIASLAYAIIGPIAMLTIIPVIAGFAFVFAKVGEASDAIEGGAKAIAWMALAIVGMGAAMALASVLAGGSIADFAKGALIITAGIALFGVTFYFLGKFSEDIGNGAKAAAWMGLAIISLAVGLGVWQVFNIGLQSIIIAAAGVALIGIAFGLIGIFSEYIEDGAKAMVWTGISIAILALAIGGFKLLGIGWEDLALVGAAITGVGLLFAGAGLLSVPIAFGAIAIMAAGAAMIVLSVGIGLLNLTYKKAMDGLFAPSDIDAKRTNMEVMIDSIVKAFSINLIDSVLMFAGGIALIFVSAAMITLSMGIWAMQRHADSTLWQQSGVGKMTNIELMIDSIVKAFSISPIDSVFMLLGAASLLVVSISMLTLAAGIWAIGRHVDSPLWQESAIKPAWADGKMTNLELMIGTIVESFSINPIWSVFMMVGSAALMLASITMMVMSGGIALLGKVWSKNSDLFSPSEIDAKRTNMEVIFGSIVEAMALGPLDMLSLYASVPAWLMVGMAIRNIGQGVADFVKIYEAGIDPGVLSEALSTVLTGVVGSIISADADTDWDAVEDGLEAISGVGDAVTGIADAVQKFAELKFPVYNEKGEVVKYLTLNDGVFKNVALNMKLMIGAVAGTLTEIGKQQGETGWFSKTAGEKGADIIRGIGGDLKNIAEFVKMAADLRMPMYDSNGKIIEGRTTQITAKMLGKDGIVSQNIRNMIMAVTSALGEVGRNPDADLGWWSGESNMTEGAKAIKGVGRDLKDLADVVLKMSEVRDITKAEKRIKHVLSAMPGIITAVAPAYENAKEQMRMVRGHIKKLLEPMQDLLSFMDKAASSKASPEVGRRIGGSISALFSEISKAGSTPGLSREKLKPITDFVSNLAKYESPISKLANSFEKLANNMKGFSKAYSAMNTESIGKHKMLIDSLVVFSKVDPNALNAVSDRGKELLDYINGGGPKKKQQTEGTQPAEAPKKAEQAGTKPVGGKAGEKASGGGEKKGKSDQGSSKMDLSELNTTMSQVVSKLGKIEILLSGTIRTKEQP